MVRPKAEVMAEAQKMKKKVHFGALMALCHVKRSELQKNIHRYKGCIPFRGDDVKDETGSFAVFSEQGTRASLMAAAKLLDAFARMPGCEGEHSDAVGGYTQITWEEAAQLLGLDVRNVGFHSPKPSTERVGRNR